MCLEIKNKKNKKIAESDITCYKLVIKRDDELVTFFQNIPVVIGSTYTSDFSFDIMLGKASVVKGLHSVPTINDCRKIVRSYLACFNLNDEEIQISVAECIIPSGSEYYVGKFEDINSYASTAITYQSIVKTYTSDELIKLSEIEIDKV